MKKTFATLGVLMVILMVLTVTQVFAAPSTFSIDGKPEKTPGAQATINAEKWLEKHPDKVKGADNAEDAKSGKKVNYLGTVASVNETQLELTLKDGSLVAFMFSEDASIKAPKLNPNKKPDSGDTVMQAPELTVGMKVMVKALIQEDGSLLVSKLMVIPGKPEKTHHVGVVTAYTPGVSISITTKDDQVSEYLLTEATKYLPEDRMADLVVGARVTVISPRDVTSNLLSAAGVVIHPAQDVESTEP